MPTPERPTTSVVLALVVTQVAFASLAIVGKVVTSTVPWPAVAFLRVAGGALVLALVSLRGRGVLPPRAALPTMAKLAMLGVVLNMGFYLAGLHLTGAINASLLVSTIPVFAVAFALATGREPPRARLVAGLVVALAGAVLVARPAEARLSPRALLGDAFVVTNAASYAVFLSLAKDAMAVHGAARVNTWVFVVATAIVAPPGLYFLARSAGDFTPRAWLSLGYIVLVPTALAYALNAWALERARTSLVAVFIYLQPVAAVVMALAAGDPLARWLGVPEPHERLTVGLLLGGGAILAGVALATVPSSRRRA